MQLVRFRELCTLANAFTRFRGLYTLPRTFTRFQMRLHVCKCVYTLPRTLHACGDLYTVSNAFTRFQMRLHASEDFTRFQGLYTVSGSGRVYKAISFPGPCLTHCPTMATTTRNYQTNLANRKAPGEAMATQENYADMANAFLDSNSHCVPPALLGKHRAMITGILATVLENFICTSDSSPNIYCTFDDGHVCFKWVIRMCDAHCKPFPGIDVEDVEFYNMTDAKIVGAELPYTPTEFEVITAFLVALGEAIPAITCLSGRLVDMYQAGSVYMLNSAVDLMKLEGFWNGYAKESAPFRVVDDSTRGLIGFKPRSPLYMPVMA